MNLLKLIIIVLLVLMSISAGLAKVRQLPQEVIFFEELDIGLIWMTLLGIIQVAGGFLAAVQKTRKIGASIIALTFLVSTLMIFISGNMVLGAVSLMATLLAGFLAWTSAPRSPNKP